MAKTALISGANKGIGKEIARQLGRDGFTVLLGARDEARGREAAQELQNEGIDARFVALEVTDADSIATAAGWVETNFGALDVLVNNAGILIDDGAASSTSLETLRKTYETNVFAPVAMTNAFLPLLKKALAARIVNVSSGLGSLSRHSDLDNPVYSTKYLAYDSSKSALNAITTHFAYELKDTPIKVNASVPGFTATDINGNSGTQTVEQGARSSVRLATLPGDGPTGGFFDENGIVAW